MKIFVHNIPYSCSDAELRTLCEQYGRVYFITMPKGREGQSRGFGFIDYVEEADYNRALEQLNGQEFQGRKLLAEPARPRDADR
jgi:RNA recognition motif-containing protein